MFKGLRWLFVLTLVVMVSVVVCRAGGPAGHMQGPPLDHTLMGMKEQGVWYFPCVAPEFNPRIPPHYATYGPPPPPYCAPPCGPVGPPPIRK